MGLSEFTFRILLIFIPGLITYLIVDKLTVHKEHKITDKLIYSFIFGFLCYIIYLIIITCSNNFLNTSIQFHFIESLTNKNASINLQEIGLVTLLSFPLGIILTYFVTYKLLHKFAHLIKASEKFGDIDVWSYIMNSNTIDWVLIRDVENNLMYEGWIEAYSDETERDEIFLRDAKVYTNDTDEFLYDIDGIYLPMNREKLRMEFYNINENIEKEVEDHCQIKKEKRSKKVEKEMKA